MGGRRRSTTRRSDRVTGHTAEPSTPVSTTQWTEREAHGDAAAAEAVEAHEMQPLDVDGVRTVVIGTAVWIVALVALIPFYGVLRNGGHDWWIWTCLAGIGLGLIGLTYCRHRRSTNQARAETAVPTVAADPAPGPSGPIASSEPAPSATPESEPTPTPDQAPRPEPRPAPQATPSAPQPPPPGAAPRREQAPPPQAPPSQAPPPQTPPSQAPPARQAPPTPQAPPNQPAPRQAPPDRPAPGAAPLPPAQRPAPEISEDQTQIWAELVADDAEQTGTLAELFAEDEPRPTGRSGPPAPPR